MKEPLISIILPAKNAGLFLKETLESILHQSYKNWECICVNDNSRDHTSKILKEFTSLDIRFVKMDNPKNGVISALQRGYNYSKGELITRMDADDLMPKDRLRVLSEKLKSYGRGHVATGKVNYFNTLGKGFLRYEKWLNGLVNENNHWANVYKECVIASPNWMMWRSDFEAINGFNSEVYPEDYELVFRMYAHGLKVVSANEVTLYWRDHEQRASRTSELYADNRFLPLKLNYWKTLEYNGQEVVLLGAGKKGKAVSKELQRLKIPFKWVTNNPKKIGHDIYGVVLESAEKQSWENASVLVALSSPPEVTELEEELLRHDLVLGENYWILF